MPEAEGTLAPEDWLRRGRQAPLEPVCVAAFASLSARCRSPLRLDWRVATTALMMAAIITPATLMSAACTCGVIGRPYADERHAVSRAVVSAGWVSVIAFSLAGATLAIAANGRTEPRARQPMAISGRSEQTRLEVVARAISHCHSTVVLQQHAGSACVVDFTMAALGQALDGRPVGSAVSWSSCRVRRSLPAAGDRNLNSPVSAGV